MVLAPLPLTIGVAPVVMRVVICPVIVPPARAKLPDAVPVNAAVIVPALKLPEPSRATMAPAVLAFVAFDVTVNVALPDWLAVNVCDPDRPVPDTFIVSVPLLTLDAVVAVDALPFKAAVIVPALKLPEPSRATMAPAVLAFVAFDVTVNVALPDWLAVNVCDPDRPVPDTFIVSVPLLTLEAVVAVVAFPLKLAVIVPALKLPEASRATMVDAVLAFVAVIHEGEAPLPPDCKSCPEVPVLVPLDPKLTAPD